VDALDEGHALAVGAPFLEPDAALTGLPAYCRLRPGEGRIHARSTRERPVLADPDLPEDELLVRAGVHVDRRDRACTGGGGARPAHRPRPAPGMATPVRGRCRRLAGDAVGDRHLD